MGILHNRIKDRNSGLSETTGARDSWLDRLQYTYPAEH